MKTNHFKENREQLMVLSILITFLIPKSATNGKYAVWEETVPPQAGPPPHTHPDEEVFYVLEGEFEFMLNGALIPAKTGSIIHVPSNELHNYKNVGNVAGKLLTMITPGLPFLAAYCDKVPLKINQWTNCRIKIKRVLLFLTFFQLFEHFLSIFIVRIQLNRFFIIQNSKWFVA